MSSENILEIFGQNVQKYRKAKQISQEKLAEISGVHRTYVGMIERAEKNITLNPQPATPYLNNIQIYR